MRKNDGTELLRVFRTKFVSNLLVAASTKEQAIALIRDTTNFYHPEEDILLVGIKGMGYDGKPKIFFI